MKQCVKIISVILILFMLLNTTALADECLGWYIVKKGNSTPGFPSTEQIDKLNGYYIDKKSAENNEKVLYITFDAGYENGNVSKILDILKDNSVPAAFFILSNIINKNSDVVKRMFEEGHLVCNHTKNHKNMATLTNEEMAANLRTLEDLCYKKTGYKMEKYFRFPEGRYDYRTLKCASDLGYSTFFWSLAYADWDNSKKPNKEQSIERIISNTHPGAIILLHPTSQINVEILPSLIIRWHEMGYTFGTLHDLVNTNK